MIINTTCLSPLYLLFATSTLLLLLPQPRQPCLILHPHPLLFSSLCHPYLMEQHTNLRSVKIERKSFSIDIDESTRGSKVWITEATEDRAFSIAVHWSTLRWIIDSFKDLIDSPLIYKFFKERRIDDQIIWLEKVGNIQGYSAELVFGLQWREKPYTHPSGTKSLWMGIIYWPLIYSQLWYQWCFCTH